MKKYITNTLGVAVLTLLSQGMGYIREMLFAFYLGTSKGLEAFQVAETVPLLFTQVLISAVPLALTPLLVREQEEKKDSLIHNAIVLWSIVLIILAGIIWMFPETFVKIVAPGFTGEKYLITCRLVTILVPNIFFLSMVAVLNSFLNSRQQFIVPTGATLFLNGSIIAIQILTKANVYYVAWGSVCGGILMFLTVLIYCIHKYKFQLKIRRVNIKNIGIIIASILPVCIISSFTSINLMMDKFFASQLGDGAVAILSYSYKIINLPVYLFVTSVTKVMLPDITKLIVNNQHIKLSETIKKVILFCISGGTIAIIIIQIFGNWIVHLLFGRGAFMGSDIIATADALKFYAFGIAGMALSSFFQSISYAEGRYFEPFRVLAVQILVYIGVTSTCLKNMGVNAIVLGNVVAISVSVLIWLIVLRKNYNINIFHRGKKWED
ncbi:lipid II flippase MurJ [Anaerostipes sp.]|uniref:lipid II flippase MurJ n=1 Tax=Anaerostipes sp. TaxID=1872530 RepID=UPI0025BA4994|nr:lipid II flippase MurJ [Anaerostipes sp.]MBS7007117.1 polysaccharide biosynthesis C-terminal domain-containing protein [Anaerostipes sp.]